MQAAHSRLQGYHWTERTVYIYYQTTACVWFYKCVLTRLVAVVEEEAGSQVVVAVVAAVLQAQLQEQLAAGRSRKPCA